MKASCVIILSAAVEELGRALAMHFSIPAVDAMALESHKIQRVERFLRAQLPPVQKGEPQYVFLFADSGLSLAYVSDNQFLSIRADFHSPSVNYRRKKGGGRGQMIAKAVGLGSGSAPSILDATAGLGGDAFVLASLGASLTMTERVPEVRALLADGLRVSREWGDLHDAQLPRILSRMRLVESDAATYMSTLASELRPDVVYLDPMFPARQKSAQVKKEMQVFHYLIGSDPDADELLELACSCALKRVVVKRPRIAPLLAGATPSFALEGKSNRFDVYLTK
jgi:16S rRNA (guanine1516-N2)-methyltransferase